MHRLFLRNNITINGGEHVIAKPWRNCTTKSEFFKVGGNPIFAHRAKSHTHAERVDYQKEYEEYWSRPDRWGSHSFRNPDLIADQIASLCGTGKILDVGFGMGLLVKTLLARGIDACGMDIAECVVREANSFAPGHFTAGSMLAMPFPDGAFETIVSTDCMEHIAEADLPKVLAEFYRVAQRYLFIRLATTPDRDKRWHLTIRNRTWWEQQFFQAGFRKHPAIQTILPYESLETENWQITLAFEKIPPAVLDQFPLSSLKPERDLHMDMLRESGRRSDAHIARYMLARQFLPKEGLVLDAACGLGYGSAILAQSSPSVRVIGMDSSAFAVNYARANFGGSWANVEFCEGDVNHLRNIADNSVSLVASFETIEHLREPELFLAEVQRVLQPGGVFLSSVPNLWVDETGKDPNPHHFHVFDFPKLAVLCRKFFKLREVYRQTAGGGMKLPNAPRELRRVNLPVTSQTEHAEWWLVAAEKEPAVSIQPPSKNGSHSNSKGELILLTSDPTHPFYTSWLPALDRPWRALNPAHADLNLLRDAGLIVTHDTYVDPGRKLAREVFGAGIPTLILADGILEYRNTWEHPKNEPGAIFQPVLGHKIACLGRSQARILESWGNIGKCEIVGSPRFDGYCELQRRQKRPDEPFRILVM
ncbi:MAG TPA: class I SAM-dependent methyltransferase, partial [Verrucomicrobiae bacterium]|nr:class I SAM-dependent methyltransferase [Verrucomicrobiae bacterium]